MKYLQRRREVREREIREEVAREIEAYRDRLLRLVKFNGDEHREDVSLLYNDVAEAVRSARWSTYVKDKAHSLASEAANQSD